MRRLSPSKIAAGRTRKKFTIVDPIIVPDANPKFPVVEEVIETESSGSVVPNETTTIPITRGDILNTLDNFTDRRTKI
jgi:hypothetical protein